GKVYPEQGEALRRTGRRRGGLARVDIPGVELTSIHGERRWSAMPVQEALSRLRDGGAVTEPNHVVLGSQIVRGVPVGGEANFAGGMMFQADVIDTEVGPVLRSTSDPAPAPSWLRQPLGLGSPHRPPQVLVLDTGLRTSNAKGAAAEHPALTCARVHAPWVRDPKVGAVDDEDEYDDDASRTLDFEAGHGTFITGIIQQICPDAEVHVAGVLSSFGDGDVDTVIASFERALTHAGPFDLVVLSLGGYMSDDDGGLFTASLDRLLGDGLGIAAAGNQSTSRPYYPAASPSIVGVGGLGQADKAWFTNFGGWVDACAPAIDVISTFFLGDPGDLDEPPFTGWARWSGTSFAAPKVAAVIAQDMYLTTSTARDSWKRLSNHQRYRFPDLGIVFNV
ncbi:MAG: S8/S53 family peptidase, partial [Ilumatobacteraceae bacterium]